MKNCIKYLLSLFLAFVVIANDGTVDFQTKSADYYQSSFVILRRELNFRTSRFYIYKQLKDGVSGSFLIPVIYLQLKDVCNLQVRTVQKLQKLLYQNLHSFMRQSVFMNEIITSNNFYKSLYSA
ncbi:hypothetical protein ASF10_05285 [Flavobacterium sp. Leaf82]|uniref:hypothetical protein n=1 Tax=unclassified Flavobacterium TaxID=196869 RepID=UPI0006F9318B|nr:hypothetical protein [Flavobacterium sp. Leaf82]KQO29920.1 hypothetical protein ASF10_05285 [Flavobacterium sp. Leaf82]